MNAIGVARSVLSRTACIHTPAAIQLLAAGRNSISPLCASSAAGPRLRRRPLSSSALMEGSEDECHNEEPEAAKGISRRRRERPPPITLTERASAHIEGLLAGKPGKAGVRLGVKRRGCNGLSYTMKYVEDVPPRDEVVSTAGGSRIFVDPMATLYVVGTVMDWEETELSAEFTFTNPNAKGNCGCGESFNV
ncbi:unnamed protein product [Discosporangium mesarthrocarpum]